VDVNRESGEICVGVLNGTTQHWLVTPDRFRPEVEFVEDTSGVARIVIANCNPDPTGSPASRFTIRSAQLSIESGVPYADQLMKTAVESGYIIRH
jgi:hypothetical protein